jgi:hypothetical protein
VLEDTDFSYLRDSVSEALTAVRTASSELRAGQEERSAETLERAIDSLLKLRCYYIPMTEVRQLLYDGDRVFYLGHIDKAQQKLKATTELLVDIARSSGPSLDKSMNELILMIDDLLLNIQESSDMVPQKFREVGHKANLMATKGELILSDVEFHCE